MTAPLTAPTIGRIVHIEREGRHDVPAIVTDVDEDELRVCVTMFEPGRDPYASSWIDPVSSRPSIIARWKWPPRV